MFEVFAPSEYLLNARLGPHYVGIEYQVPDADEARAEVQARGMRVIRELGVAIHVHPAEALGVAWEFFGRSFHDDPPPVQYVEPLKPSDYWRDEHPLGYTGLKRYSVAVSDLVSATTFFEDFLGATVVYEEARPAVAARAVGLALADTVAELISPIGAGPIERFLARYGDGIRSTVFAVRDVDQAKRYFAARGVVLHPGDAPGSVAIAPEDNVGLLFEFSE
jgi:catechol 2,3-dioxygenase-like lactoylglutathione lyase family enzyme